MVLGLLFLCRQEMLRRFHGDATLGQLFPSGAVSLCGSLGFVERAAEKAVAPGGFPEAMSATPLIVRDRGAMEDPGELGWPEPEPGPSRARSQLTGRSSWPH